MLGIVMSSERRTVHTRVRPSNLRMASIALVLLGALGCETPPDAPEPAGPDKVLGPGMSAPERFQGPATMKQAEVEAMQHKLSTSSATGYMVEVHTCDTEYAGTDSTISMTMKVRDANWALKDVGPWVQDQTQSSGWGTYD